MTTIETIRAEIERRKVEAEGFRRVESESNIAAFYNGEATALENLLSFLDTLEEKPVDLEKDAVMYCFDKGINLSPRVAREFARHFYELGRNAK